MPSARRDAKTSRAGNGGFGIPARANKPLLTIREDGEERLVTAAEALLLQLAKKGLEGDSAAARDMLAFLEGQLAKPDDRSEEPKTFRMVFVAVGSVNDALEPLRMANKLDRLRDTARMAVEPWLVEAALGRLGHNHRLTEAEQRTVVAATRTPWKVKWPTWWTVRPKRAYPGGDPRIASCVVHDDAR